MILILNESIICNLYDNEKYTLVAKLNNVLAKLNIIYEENTWWEGGIYKHISISPQKVTLTEDELNEVLYYMYALFPNLTLFYCSTLKYGLVLSLIQIPSLAHLVFKKSQESINIKDYIIEIHQWAEDAQERVHKLNNDNPNPSIEYATTFFFMQSKTYGPGPK